MTETKVFVGFVEGVVWGRSSVFESSRVRDTPGFRVFSLVFRESESRGFERFWARGWPRVSVREISAAGVCKNGRGSGLCVNRPGFVCGVSRG